MATNNHLKELQDKVEEVLPKECDLTRIEIEGPQVVLYLKNMRAFTSDENLITRIASHIRKKVLLRSDSSVLMPPEKAMEVLKQLIPKDAGVTEIKFDATFNEVVIEAMKPGVVIGKNGMVLKSIILETAWSPKVLRAPTSPSEVEKAIRASMLNTSEERKKFLNTLGKKMLQDEANPEWVKITALGGFKEVGRSCILLQTNNSNILMDVGLNVDTSDNSKNYPYLNAMGLQLDQIDAVIITHAHLDHQGFLPYLYAYGYDGPTYCTPPTRDLMVLLQQDCINVMAQDGKTPPYSEKDIKKTLNHVIVRKFGEVTDITPKIRFTFHNAGHILGSAMIHLHIGDGLHNVVYTGDLKFGRTNLFDQADIRFPRVDSILMESTYGGASDVKPRLEESEQKLVNVIRETIANRGKVLIPVLAVGRAQEIMLIMEKYMRNDDVPIYIDGMVREASAIHTVYPEYLRRDVQRRILQNDSPFDKPIFRSAIGMDRKSIVEDNDPAIIVATSGMLSGGPSVEFLKLMAGDPKNALMFVGYQAPMSLGRKLLNGEKEVPILNNNKLDSLKVNLKVANVDGFSGHSDRTQLINFARAIKPRPSKFFMLHGEESKCEDLARTIGKMLHVESRAPQVLDSMRLK
ncbi:MAG TPA: beta-CASP ribonuclease aCPSF1 [Candidatus Norongarragalinales archaeon]|nr:beta-CASP ribonuclease aCPSF1 [Candidatus Norongarragalinales archaeon]